MTIGSKWGYPYTADWQVEAEALIKEIEREGIKIDLDESVVPPEIRKHISVNKLKEFLQLPRKDVGAAGLFNFWIIGAVFIAVILSLPSIINRLIHTVRHRFMRNRDANSAGILVFGLVLTLRSVSHELELARMKSDFVSTVSHEFKSPLTSIRQLAEMLQGGRVPSDERRQKY